MNLDKNAKDNSPKRETEVQIWLKVIDNELDRAEKTHEEMDGRLINVLSAPTPEIKEDTEEAIKKLTPLAEQLREMARRLCVLSNGYEDLIDRIEL